MDNCCCDLNKVFCSAFNKYYNTLEVNGEISQKETDNLLIIGYIRHLIFDDRYSEYYNMLIKALRCIASTYCLIDGSQLYNRGRMAKKPIVCNDP